MDKDKISILQVKLADQTFGVRISEISDIIVPQKFTYVPQSGKAIAGLINLRGYIVTLIRVSHILGIPDEDLHKIEEGEGKIIVVEQGSDLYGLLFDDVSDIIDIDADEMEPISAVLDEEWGGVASGVFRLEPDLVVLLNTNGLVSAAEPSKNLEQKVS